MIRLLLALVLVSSTGWAHDPGLSSATVDLSSRDFLVQVVFAPADLAGFQAVRFADLAAKTVELRTLRGPLTATSTETRELGTDNIEFTLRFPRPAGAVVTLQSPLLARLPLGHRQAVIVRDEAGAVIATELLSANRDQFQLPTAPPSAAPTSGRFPALLAGALALAAVGWFFGRRRVIKAAA